MNSRRRFLNTMRFKTVDRVPFTEFLGFDPETIKRWESEGLSSSNLSKVFGLELPKMLPVDLECLPRFNEEILEQSEDFVVRKTGVGRIERVVTHTYYMIPEVLSYPIKTPEDWSMYKRRLVFSKERLPDLSKYADRDYPLYLYMRGGFFGQPRLLMGDEALMYAYYDYPVIAIL